MDNILALSALLISCYLLLCIIKPSGIVEITLVVFISFTALIIEWGYVLSALNQLGNVAYWQNFGLGTALILFCIVMGATKSFSFLPPKPGPFWQSIKAGYAEALDGHPFYVRLSLGPMAFTVFFVGVFNLVLILTLPPHEWDSMAYHLPRMAHYLQQNNLNYFEANYWAQIVHPKNSTLLLLYSFLIPGRNENLTQLPQYFSYWVILFSIYGISRKIGLTAVQGFFSALLGGLLIDMIVQANTSQNDLVISAYFASTTYFLYAFRETKKKKYLLLAAAGIGIAIGTKASALMVLPSMGLILLATTYTGYDHKSWLKSLWLFSIYVLLAVCVFVVPSGYMDNYRLFGNPFGNQDVSTTHTFSGKSIEYIMQGGLYNILRYGVDSFSLSGLPPTEFVNAIQEPLQIIPRKLLPLLGIDLETRDATSFSWFEYNRPAHSLYWGILGFGLIGIITVLALFHFFKNPDFFILALATAIFWVGIAYSGPYDAAKGRYFSMCIPFVVPLAGICLDYKARAVRIYLAAVLALGCVSAVSAVIIKTLPMSATYPALLKKSSIYKMDRIEQLTFNYQKYYVPMITFDRIVPQDAVVAVFLYPNTFEYPLYGKFLTRKILSINSFYGGLQNIPPEAQFLLYTKGYPCPIAGDKQLGFDWFLRELDDENRTCSSVPSP